VVCDFRRKYLLDDTLSKTGRYLAHAIECLYASQAKRHADALHETLTVSLSEEQAWKETEGDQRVRICPDLTHVGVAMIGNEQLSKEKYRIPLL